ncbi:MAG: hypothetical protein IPL65_22490 [Lewinellaceae bacterium]|nr:hypothetical protein [Lewinellaceae bacterium]
MQSLLPLFILFLLQCQSPPAPNGPKLLSYFQITEAADTLHLELPQPGEMIQGDTIPNAVFFKELPANFLQEIDYLADANQALVLGLQRYHLDADNDVCLVDIQQFWFRNQSLLVYNHKKKSFTARITVAEWYGGDGGQILTGSWMFDYNDDGYKDLIIREIEHSSILDDDGDLRENSTHQPN